MHAGEAVMARKLPHLIMRGGTSRGVYILKEHLPMQDDNISKVLLAAMGTVYAHPGEHFQLDRDRTVGGGCQVNGLGGGTSITNKVAILSRSACKGVDVDYRFAQVSTSKAYVDFEPSCGNLLAGVGPAAIEMGLVSKLGREVTKVVIRATNNGTTVEAVVRTPQQKLAYDIITSDQVDGDGALRHQPAPVLLNFMDVVGSTSGGRLLPTNNVVDVIDGVEVTCIDVAIPMVIARASSMGKTGYECKQEYDHDCHFFARLEAIRRKAGLLMGLGDVAGRVLPKFGLVAEPRSPGASFTARYFVPDSCHPAMAVTGAICMSSCSILRDSVAYDLARRSSVPVDSCCHPGLTHDEVVIEHPSGSIKVLLKSFQKPDTREMHVVSAGIERTARWISAGVAFVPDHWEREEPRVDIHATILMSRNSHTETVIPEEKVNYEVNGCETSKAESLRKEIDSQFQQFRHIFSYGSKVE